MWTGGISPGLTIEENDVYAFDVGHRGAGQVVRGDVVLAIWFQDHKSECDKPAVAYAFHTAFVDCRGSAVEKEGMMRVRVTARQLDVGNQSEFIIMLSEFFCFFLYVYC